MVNFCRKYENGLLIFLCVCVFAFVDWTERVEGRAIQVARMERAAVTSGVRVSYVQARLQAWADEALMYEKFALSPNSARRQ